MLHHIEEVGELAKAVRKKATNMGIDKTKINLYIFEKCRFNFHYILLVL